MYDLGRVCKDMVLAYFETGLLSGNLAKGAVKHHT